jgi:hypothetical protein
MGIVDRLRMVRTSLGVFIGGFWCLDSGRHDLSSGREVQHMVRTMRKGEI